MGHLYGGRVAGRVISGGNVGLSDLAFPSFEPFFWVRRDVILSRPTYQLKIFSSPLLHRLTSLKLAHVVWTGKRYLHITRLHAQYGTIIRTGPNTLSLNTASPQAISALYASSNAFEKSAAYNLPGRGNVGKGLFFMRGRGEHRIRKKAWAKGFGTGAAMDGYTEVLEKRVGEMMECAVQNAGKEGSVDWADLVQRWSFDCIGEVCLGDVYDIVSDAVFVLHATELSTKLQDLLKNGDPKDHVKSGVLSTALFETSVSTLNFTGKQSLNLLASIV